MKNLLKKARNKEKQQYFYALEECIGPEQAHEHWFIVITLYEYLNEWRLNQIWSLHVYIFIGSCFITLLYISCILCEAIFQFPLFTVGSKWGDLIPATGNEKFQVPLLLSVDGACRDHISHIIKYIYFTCRSYMP